MAISYTVCIDWDNDGSFATAGDDITAHVMQLSTSIGITDQLQAVAQVGRCTLTCNNIDRRFSPAYTGGPLSGKLKPNLHARVQVTDGVTTWTEFRGTTRAFQPGGPRYVDPTVIIECEDLIGTLRDAALALPYQTDKTSDELLKLITSEAFRTAAASGTITFSGAAANNDTVTVNGTVYTFKTTLTPTAGEVKIGADAAACAANLRDAINNKPETNGTAYADGTARPDGCTALIDYDVNDAQVIITANARGAWGNTITLAESCTNCTVSGATLSGGVDGPVGLIDYETGIQTFADAADKWTRDTTKAYRAVAEVVESTGTGLFWAARNGTLVSKNRDWIFKQQATANTLALNSQPNTITGGLDINNVYNRAVVSFSPRASLAEGVVARARGVISVPGHSNYAPGTGNYKERWNASDALADAGTTTVLPYVDAGTGARAGAVSIIPPVAGTDYTLNDQEDGTGHDYTINNFFFESVAIGGSGVELTLSNGAIGRIFVIDQQVRGVLRISYDPLQALAEDTTSIAAYGVRELPWSLALSSSANFASAFAVYLVSKYKDPSHIARTIPFRGQTVVGGVNIFSVELGNIIELTDYQTGISAQRYIVTGKSSTLGKKSESDVVFYVRRLDDVNYGIWDDATYGKWDTAKWAL